LRCLFCIFIIIGGEPSPAKIVEITLILIEIVNIEAGRQYERSFHTHDCSELVVITAGAGKHILGGEQACLSPGDVLLIHPGYTHGYDECGTLGLVNVLYDSKRLPFPALDGESMPLFHHFFPGDRHGFSCSAQALLHLKPETMEVILPRIQALHNELLSGIPGSLLYGIAKFTEIIVLLSRNVLSPNHTRSDDDRIVDAIEYLNQNFVDEINLGELPHRSYMSRRNFHRHFYRMTGCSPLEYINRRRLLYSLTLLQTTHSSIKEVALQCGFNSSNYFCRKFRAMFQLSPLQFRTQKLL